jgi:hypothetical protein
VAPPGQPENPAQPENNGQQDPGWDDGKQDRRKQSALDFASAPANAEVPTAQCEEEKENRSA